jgi:tripartite-type tricarboxylate transporter receptor subunit TctC
MSVLLKFTVSIVLGLTLCSAAAIAAEFPSKPVRIIVPFAPGGGADLTTRIIARHLGGQWSQPVIVENISGAGGNIGYEAAARAQPDGSTLVIGTNAMTINVTLYRNVPYDPIKSFTPISKTTEEPNILVVRNELASRSVRELIELARSSPGKLTYASGGNGTTSHLFAELMKGMAGMDIRHVPYKSPISAMTDLMNGTTDMFFAGQGFGAANIKAGKLRALAISSRSRSSVFPDIPTLSEAGLPGFDAIVWLGVLAPAKATQDVVAKVHEGVVQSLRATEVKGRLEELGFKVVGDTPAEFSAFMKSEVEKWGGVIRSGGIKLD